MMKKSAKILSGIMAFAIGVSVFGLTACGGTTPNVPDEPITPEHTHTFAATWEKNDTQHWHPATCEHKDEKGNIANHNTSGSGGSCSVCGFTPEPVEHVHTFEEGWDYDGVNHWHSASCEHYTITDGLAKHDYDENGACKVCDYAIHIHKYDTTQWKINSIAHWHAATCDGSNAKDALIFSADSGYHDYDENLRCKVCDYQHEHPVAEYKAVDSTGHWDAWDCWHQAQGMKDKPNFEAHDTAGANGACSKCGWLPIVETPEKDETGAVINNHTHTWEWQYNVDSHWQKITCGLKSYGCKSCDKGYNAEDPKNRNMGAHTFGDNGICTVCKYNYNSWGYGTDDCIKCDDCDGCIKTVCAHDNEETHKKCGDIHGENAKTVTLEAEEGEVWSREDGKPGSIYYAIGGKRECIHASYSNVGWTITVSKATTVTLRIHCGRTADQGQPFSVQGAVWVNGEQVTTNTPLAQPRVEDHKCDPAWLTFGCIELKEGENRIEVRQLNENGFHLDKIELITDADVDIDFTPLNNTWLYNIGQWTPIPKMEVEA